MTQQSLAQEPQLTESELQALRRFKAAYCLSTIEHISIVEATRWQFCHWLVATGRIGTDDGIRPPESRPQGWDLAF